MYIPTTALVLGALAAIITVAASIDTNTEQLQFIWHTPGQDTLDHHGPPHHKPLPWPGTGQETIYTVLSNDKEYTKLIKAVNFAGEIVSVLNDSSAHLTFFAVPDSALRNPHKRTLDADISTITSLEQVYDLSDVIHLVDEFDAYSSSDQDDDDKKKCKKFLQKLVRAILSYHILPSRFGVTNLGDNTTYATNLVLPDALGARPLRIRHDPISSLDAKLQTALTNHFIHAHVEKFKVSVPIPGPHKPHKITTKLTVNGRHVFPQDIVGLNGAIHVIDHLLDPRGQHHHRHSHDKFTDADPAWVDWQDWLPQWAD
ncbi:hypothetical protein H0H81_002902 [Sphagnurus paluster]|uniref:FAS1 domain-containing protein n=1 Tax=Sphagnurus paluster TaxID=117069 RepID=A0A9P7FX00_9AGAR|nr:hypothetical protein H0H81_002902 [Sphagnurus paluster]